jgi:hypothetical protein
MNGNRHRHDEREERKGMQTGETPKAVKERGKEGCDMRCSKPEE